MNRFKTEMIIPVYRMKGFKRFDTIQVAGEFSLVAAVSRIDI